MRERSGREVDQVIAVNSGGTLIDYAFLNSRKRLAGHARLAALPALLIGRLFPFFDAIAEGLSSLLNRFAAFFGFGGESRACKGLSILRRDLSLPLHPCRLRGI